MCILKRCISVIIKTAIYHVDALKVRKCRKHLIHIHIAHIYSRNVGNFALRIHTCIHEPAHHLRHSFILTCGELDHPHAVSFLVHILMELSPDISVLKRSLGNPLLMLYRRRKSRSCNFFIRNAPGFLSFLFIPGLSLFRTVDSLRGSCRPHTSCDHKSTGQKSKHCTLDYSLFSYPLRVLLHKALSHIP